MKKTVAVPSGMSVQIDGRRILLKGKHELATPPAPASLQLSTEGNNVIITSSTERRRDKALVGTYAALVKSLAAGAEAGYEARMKVIHSHFPIKVTVDGGKITIANFLGEKQARQARAFGKVTVTVEKDEVIIRGASKEEVGQTAANLERATKIKGFDRRIFQDGIYTTQTPVPVKK